LTVQTGLPVLERASELRQLADVIDAAGEGNGRLIVIEGEPGIGKSTLVGAAIERARPAGLRVLRARASELERQYPYGIALGLFEPLVHDRSVDHEELFAGVAAAAQPLFTPTAERADAARTPAGDPFATVHGLYWLCLNAAEQGPVLLTVDDAQWSDEGSLRFLHYLGQRVGELPIVLVLAFRTGPFADAEPARSIRESPAATAILPEPLSESRQQLVPALAEAPGGSRISG
jgi:hypothetical protein